MNNPQAGGMLPSIEDENSISGERQQASLGHRIVESEAYDLDQPLNKHFSCVSFGGPKPIKDENNLSGQPL